MGHLGLHNSLLSDIEAFPVVVPCDPRPSGQPQAQPRPSVSFLPSRRDQGGESGGGQGMCSLPLSPDIQHGKTSDKGLIMHLLVILIFLLIGCSGNPVPESVVKECLDKGWIPIYTSNGFHTRFLCVDPTNLKSVNIN